MAAGAARPGRGCTLRGARGASVLARVRARAHALRVRLPLDRRSLARAQARRRARLRLELRAGRPVGGLPAVPPVHARAAARHPALEPAHHGRQAVPGQRAVGDLLALQRRPLTCCRSGARWPSSRCSRCSSPRSGCSCSRAALSMRWPGAFLAGLVFGFGPFFVVWLAWPLSSVWAWLPWLLLLTERLVRSPDALAICGLAAITALQFLGGHPESSFHSLFAALAFYVPAQRAAAALGRGGAGVASALDRRVRRRPAAWHGARGGRARAVRGAARELVRRRRARRHRRDQGRAQVLDHDPSARLLRPADGAAARGLRARAVRSTSERSR